MSNATAQSKNSTQKQNSGRRNTAHVRKSQTTANFTEEGVPIQRNWTNQRRRRGGLKLNSSPRERISRLFSTQNKNISLLLNMNTTMKADMLNSTTSTENALLNSITQYVGKNNITDKKSEFNIYYNKSKYGLTEHKQKQLNILKSLLRIYHKLMSNSSYSHL